MLELHSVDFGYKARTKALRNVSLTIQPGEFIAVAGRNGSGKTTLTRLIMGLKKPLSGKILFDGKNTGTDTPADMARHIGYVFQNPDRQIFRDTVFDEVSYGPEQLGFRADRVGEFVNEALAATGLSSLASAYPLSLSKGQKQRLAIASALAMQPEMLILDEPTSGQDAKERRQLMLLLAQLHRQGKTILLITHDMDLLACLAERVIVMDQGCKAFDGITEELFRDEERLKAWGLTEPTAVKISHALAGSGIEQTSSTERLIAQLTKQIGGNSHAKPGAID